MNSRINYLKILFLVLLVCAGCKDNPSETTETQTPSTLSGSIIDSEFGDVISGVSVTDQGVISASASSNASGAFTISFGPLSSDYTTVLYFTATGFFDTLMVVNIEPGRDMTLPDFVRMRRNSSQAITTNPDAFKASQIKYVGTSATDIDIAGVGGLENSVLTYEVRDSLGSPVAKTPRYGATFTIAFFPNSFVGGGTPPRTIPAADSTGAKGRLSVSIASGTQAGVVEVIVRVTVDSTKTITSSPVRISIHGGFPDQNHFSLMPSRFVYPGIGMFSTVGFSVAVGDTFSNPVPEGTAVYFHSQAGIMQTGSSDFGAYTNKSGLASVSQLTVNPLPVSVPFCDPTIPDYMNGGTPVGRVGYSWVFAQTQGRNGVYIRDSVFVVWNQAPIIINGMPASITMNAHSTSAVYSLTVTDANGNPLCDGTTVTASFTYPSGINGISFDVSGTIPAKIPLAGYARFPGSGITDFSFQVVDNSTANLAGYSVTLRISVNAPDLDSRSISIPILLQ